MVRVYLVYDVRHLCHFVGALACKGVRAFGLRTSRQHLADLFDRLVELSGALPRGGVVSVGRLAIIVLKLRRELFVAVQAFAFVKG